MSSYQRLIVHRVAQYFHLEHAAFDLDSQRRAVILFKTPESRVPVLRLSDLREEPDVAPQKAVRIMRRSPQHGHGQHRFTHTSVPSSSQSSSPSLSDDKSPTNVDKTLEERESEYAKARARIFNESASNKPNGESMAAIPAATTPRENDKIDKTEKTEKKKGEKKDEEKKDSRHRNRKQQQQQLFMQAISEEPLPDEDYMFHIQDHPDQSYGDEYYDPSHRDFWPIQQQYGMPPPSFDGTYDYYEYNRGYPPSSTNTPPTPTNWDGEHFSNPAMFGFGSRPHPPPSPQSMFLPNGSQNFFVPPGMGPNNLPVEPEFGHMQSPHLAKNWNGPPLGYIPPMHPQPEHWQPQPSQLSANAAPFQPSIPLDHDRGPSVISPSSSSSSSATIVSSKTRSPVPSPSAISATPSSTENPSPPATTRRMSSSPPPLLPSPQTQPVVPPHLPLQSMQQPMFRPPAMPYPNPNQFPQPIDGQWNFFGYRNDMPTSTHPPPYTMAPPLPHSHIHPQQIPFNPALHPMGFGPFGPILPPKPKPIASLDYERRPPKSTELFDPKAPQPKKPAQQQFPYPYHAQQQGPGMMQLEAGMRAMHLGLPLQPALPQGMRVPPPASRPLYTYDTPSPSPSNAVGAGGTAPGIGSPPPPPAHILEVYGLPPTVTSATSDTALADIKKAGAIIKWLDTGPIAIFKNASAARKTLEDWESAVAKGVEVGYKLRPWIPPFLATSSANVTGVPAASTSTE
jgi:hypothetical protein